MSSTPHIIGSGNRTTGTGGTYYCSPAMNAQRGDQGFNNDWSGSSNRLAFVFRTAVTASNLCAVIETNSYNQNVTFRPRSGAPYGNMTLTITAGSTADAEDTTNTDGFDATEEWTIEAGVPAGSGTFQMGAITMLFAPVADTITICANNGYPLTTAADFFTALVGLEGDETGNEWEYDHKISFACTWKNLWCRTENNTRSDTINVRSRVTGANGNQVVTWAAGVSADVEDTTHTDSVSAGAQINYLIDQNGGTGSVSLRTIKSELVSTAGQFWFNATHGNGAWGGTTSYHPPNGCLFQTSQAEATAQAKINGVAFTWSNLWTDVTFLSAGSIIIKSRINGANGNQTITDTTGTESEDTTHTDSVVDNDKICVSAVTTGGGSATFKGMSSTGTVQEGTTISLEIFGRKSRSPIAA